MVPEPAACVRCGDTAEGGFLTGTGGGLGQSLWWNQGRPPRWPRRRGTILLDERFSNLAWIPAHRCTGCGLIFLESSSHVDQTGIRR